MNNYFTRDWSEGDFHRLCKGIAKTIGVVSIIIATLVLIGWVFNIWVLVTVLPHFPAMKPNTALCFLSAGISLLTLSLSLDLSEKLKPWRLLGQVCGAIVAIIGTLTLAEYLFSINLGIDQLLLRDTLTNPLVSPPGLMSVATAAGFSFLGISLYFLGNTNLGSLRISQFLALLVALVAIIAISCFIYNPKDLYAVYIFRSMAIHTSMLLFLLSVGILHVQPERGVVAVITSKYSGGFLARRVFPFVLLFPYLAGWVELQGEYSKIYGNEFGQAIFSTVNVVFFGALIWYAAKSLSANEQKRLHELEERNKLQSELASIIESSNDAIISKDLNGIVRTWNVGAERIFGYTAKDIVGSPILRLIPPDRHQEEFHILNEIKQGKRITHLETIRVKKDGKPINISLTSSPIIDRNGKVIGASKIARDVTEHVRDVQKMEKLIGALTRSDQLYRFLADSMPQIVWTATPDGNLDYYNQRWFKYTGLTFDQTKNWGWQPVVHPEDLQLCVDRWTKSFTTGDDYEVEYRFKRASDGCYRWHLGRAFPMRNDNGEIIKWVGTCTDIDDQKLILVNLEKKVTERTRDLAALNGRLQAVMEAATQVSIIAGNPEGIITFFNVGAERMLGYASDEVVGKQRPNIIHLESEVVARGIELSRETGKIVEGFDVFVEHARQGRHEEREWTYVRKDGTHLTVNLVVTASRDLTGQIIGYLGIAMDITARKNAENELRRQALELQKAKEHAELADRAKSEFLANMSHEIRTPMNGIIGFTQFLASGKPGPLNSQQTEFLGDIMMSGRHLLQLIDDILDLSRVEAGKMNLQIESFPLTQVIQEVCEVCQPMAQKKQIKVTTTVATGLDLVTLDQQRFRQVLYNLLSNAIKFTDDGGGVTLIANLHGEDRFDLKVTDTGIGIKPDDLKRLFKEFEQLQSGTTRRYQGTGLGLALTRRIIELQGGSIGVESEVGKGSIFTITLPIKYKATA